jgi:hypothetical protein
MPIVETVLGGIVVSLVSGIIGAGLVNKGKLSVDKHFDLCTIQMLEMKRYIDAMKDEVIEEIKNERVIGKV